MVYIMSEARGSTFGVERLRALTDDLLRQGYTASEIDLAFSWLFEKAGCNYENLNAIRTPLSLYRVLHAAERMVIRPEAYSYLLQLRQLGLIDDQQLEEAIERAMQMGVSPVDTEDIKEIAATVMFDSDSFAGGYLFNDTHMGN
ncbi:MAG: DUF494 domain-containing protein [candidate division KSB1 bacterium]|nr:DUF494 domain-containing protein [candidate division KSB1 bacterium]MDZ7295897.1 DUF494 domain-containing protein [candidate division KSB1 bacterium]MDZ7339668.1 DUF494 domain-containing protein [candidate division KSB1 bacterium]MDZ7385762.1 DUF494 domain-containing protein [candidate division KSB1 bacterium]MDZ7391353.1 DUF494 domain-containing protein [candidate division KSB1 bacterium]